MTVVALIAFWLSLAICLYIYFGYPVLLWVLSRVRPLAVAEAEVYPRATFVIAVFNEEKVIGEKIRNTLSLDYPADRIEVLVVSNGSVDRTAEIVRNCTDPRVTLIELASPGKTAALNEGSKRATGDILVFSDADFLLDLHSLRELARKFADPAVGGVCGARNPAATRQGDATGEGEGLYGRWDRWLKVRESRIGSVFAADGLLYAIRRELYVPISDPALADDIAISSRVVLQGFRLLYEPAATARETNTIHFNDEFRRKIRVTHHSVRALFDLRQHLFTSGFYSVELLSHKLVRHFIPFFLIPLFVANIPLARVSPFYTVTLAGQVALYALALAGALLRALPLGRTRLLYVPYYFCFVNACAFLGILSVLRGERISAWSTRTQSS